MDDRATADHAATLRRLGLTEAMVDAHVLRPDHIADAALTVELHDVADGNDDNFLPPPSGLLYRLNVEKLGRELQAMLSRCLVGYSLELRRYGQVLLSQQWGKSKTPQDGNTPWAGGVPMHVASVSKLVTAMAMTKLLRDKGISPDAGIARWLPPAWPRGPGVDAISFRHLLTHTSGLAFGTEAGAADYAFMKAQIATGTSHLGEYNYKNLNFALCRVLLPAIEGGALFEIPGTTDAFRDLTSIRTYERYIAQNIFAPVGVSSTLVHSDPNALAYQFPASMPGWNSGDLSTMSGAVGWHLSAWDLLSLMAGFRRRGFIIDPAFAQVMLDRQFGLDLKRDTPLGRIYGKGGFWSLNGQFVEQTNVFFLPKGMELVILANSPYCAPDTGFMGAVVDTIVANIESILLRTVVSVAGLFAAAAVVGRVRRAGRRR